MMATWATESSRLKLSLLEVLSSIFERSWLWVGYLRDLDEYGIYEVAMAVVVAYRISTREEETQVYTYKRRDRELSSS